MNTLCGLIGGVARSWLGLCLGLLLLSVPAVGLARSLTATPTAVAPGDVNGDGGVNALDVVAVINHFLGLQSWAGADANSDGSVNALDVVFVINQVLGIAVNQAPQVNTGPDQTITLPAVANLTGTVTDDGLPNPPGTVTVTWNQDSGPGTVTFGNANTVGTTATFSAAGVYMLRLKADDGQLSASATVTITVNDAGSPSTTQDVPPDGGSVALPDFGSATFLAGAFSTTTAVSIQVMKDAATANLFDETTAIFAPSAQMSYMLRINTGVVAPSLGPVQVMVKVTPELIALLTPDTQPAVFAKIHMEYAEEIIDIFALMPSEYDPATQSALALLPAHAFSDQLLTDGTFEVIVTVGLVPATTSIEPSAVSLPKSSSPMLANPTQAKLFQNDSAAFHNVQGQRSVLAATTATDAQCTQLILCPIQQVEQRECIGEGYSNHAVYRGFGKEPHYGLDFKVAAGTPVFAVADGVIEKNGTNQTGYGNYLVIRHNCRLGVNNKNCPASLYAHLSTVNVVKDDEVKVGNVIAQSGNSGGSGEPRLHFEYVLKDRAIKEYCLEMEEGRCIKYKYYSPYIDPTYYFVEAKTQARYQIIRDGLLGTCSIVADSITSLEWQRCDVGQTFVPPQIGGLDRDFCTGNSREYSWYQLKLAVTGDFRIPTISELRSLVYCSNTDTMGMYEDHKPCAEWNGPAYQYPTIVEEAFPNTGAGYWSSSDYATSDIWDLAWYINFSEGKVSTADPSYTNRVRLVRLVR